VFETPPPLRRDVFLLLFFSERFCGQPPPSPQVEPPFLPRLEFCALLPLYRRAVLWSRSYVPSFFFFFFPFLMSTPGIEGERASLFLFLCCLVVAFLTFARDSHPTNSLFRERTAFLPSAGFFFRGDKDIRFSCSLFFTHHD